MEKERKYNDFLQDIGRFVPRKRIYTDELRRLAWGTDAGFYRLVPHIVIRSDNEQEVSELLKAADRHGLPVTFRAAGTSLSGQAISDSILIVAGKHWEKYRVSPDREQITLQPGIIGQRVNEILAPFGRKFAPDPASVKSAMVGGIVMNNASGMNCGTHANSDRMLVSVRIVLADGTVLDTGNESSKQEFLLSHRDFIRRLCDLRDRIRTDAKLQERIRYKYSIKNVTGLNLLPFVLYDDPFDIIAHLMVGSEGTLAFLSEVTMKTEYDYPHKASAMLYFKDIKEACRAVVAMKKLTNAQGEWIVKGAELLDWKSLASVNDPTGEGLTAVLTETKGRDRRELQRNILAIEEALKPFDTFVPVRFTDRPEEYSKYWAIRSGIFPSVGGTRPLGTTSLIEDVAFHIEDLPEATAELQQLIARHGYDDACIYGHALEGNYHFIINQSFGTEAEVKRYEALMNDVKTLVVDKYDGSLKAEHGTGRNMAPFVKYEWGEAAFEIMKAVKQLFDPKGLLNPGVIFNDDPHCHIRHFKPLPLLAMGDTPLAADKCIECGFCEVNCLTCGFTLSSRQRIVVQREISRLKQTGENPYRLEILQKQYQYPGNQTCAGDGLCSMSCPMGINTGDLTHLIRQAVLPKDSFGYKAGNFAARHFAGIKSALRPVLTLADAAHTVLGTKTMTSLTRNMHHLFGLPQWTPAMPKRYKIQETRDERRATSDKRLVISDKRLVISDKLQATSEEKESVTSYKLRATSGEKESVTSYELRATSEEKESVTSNKLQATSDKLQATTQENSAALVARSSSLVAKRVVYFPSCINQTMGLAKHSPVKQPLVNKMMGLLQKAGYEVIFPRHMEKLCCGTIWESKGMLDIADRKSAELEAALWEASEEGAYPVLCDQSPCLHRMRATIQKMKLYEPAEFIYTFLRDRLEFTQTDTPVAVHITCSMRKMGLADTIVSLARLCSSNVLVPEEVGCCGFAGDKGFTHPEVNSYALRKLRPQIERAGITVGYSNSRTCEIGLTTNAGIPYVSIVYLVDKCTQARNINE